MLSTVESLYFVLGGPLSYMAVRGCQHVWLFLLVNTVFLLGGVLVIKESQDKEKWIQQEAEREKLKKLARMARELEAWEAEKTNTSSTKDAEPQFPCQYELEYYELKLRWSGRYPADTCAEQQIESAELRGAEHRFFRFLAKMLLSKDIVVCGMPDRESCICCETKLSVKLERPHIIFGTQTMLMCPACDFHNWPPFPKNPMTVKTIDKDDETNVEYYLRIRWRRKTLYGLWMTWQGKVETKKTLYVLWMTCQGKVVTKRILYWAYKTWQGKVVTKKILYWSYKTWQGKVETKILYWAYKTWQCNHSETKQIRRRNSFQAALCACCRD
jgi:hypothetical protein